MARNRLSVLSQVLLNAGADANKATHTIGWTPMHIAARNGHVETVQVLLNAGADANKATDNGETPMYIAAMNGHTEISRMLRGFRAWTEAPL